MMVVGSGMETNPSSGRPALTRRRMIQLAAAGLAVPPIAVPHAARAAWPDRPVKLIVPFGPGGPTDVIARLLGQLLGERLGQSFVVENRPGATGNIGVGVAARAEPDGYTLLVTSNTFVINPMLFAS